MLPSFRHDLPSVEDYLHHRAPYCMVNQIVEISETTIRTSSCVDPHEAFIQGHFPGAPVIPGAMLQEMTTQSAGILIAARHNPMQQFDTHDPTANEYALGVLVRVMNSRFRGFARPGDELAIEVTLADRVGDLFEFSGQVSVNDTSIMHNCFQLANIPSSTLQGQ